MLATLDVLIGFTVVMLVISFSVTMLTQAFNSLFNLRGKALLQGVGSLITLLDKATLEGSANTIARKLLTNPLVARRTVFGGSDLAGTVHREELVKLILFEASTDAKLKSTINALGVADPLAVLSAVRMAELAFERQRPDIATDVRSTMAMIDHASSEFLARINAWFDQTMDRTSELFTLYSRVGTFVAALLVAFTLQLDSVHLLNQLSSDKAARTALVEAAIAHPEQFKPADAPASLPSPVDALKTIRDDPHLAELAQLHLIDPPAGPGDWWKKLSTASDPMARILGILLTTALLSLGGPFWYAMLENLLKLRPLLAQKEERLRAIRQTTQAVDYTPLPGALPAPPPVTPVAAAPARAVASTVPGSP